MRTRILLDNSYPAIVRQALTPDSVLFSLPALAFERRSKAYSLIESQIGPVHGFRPLSVYDMRSRRDLLIEAKFVDPAHTTKAIEDGITVDEIVHKASPSVAGSENPLLRVQLSLLHIDTDQSLKDGLLASLRYYGKVYQIRRVLCDGYYEGQLTVTIDPSVGYKDSKGVSHDAQPLQRMLYLETWDTFAPATFKGAAPVCYYCRQAGHIRNNCPALAKRVCFECGVAGHTRKFCKAKVTDTQAIELYETAVAEASEKGNTHTNADLEQTTISEEEIIDTTIPLAEQTAESDSDLMEEEDQESDMRDSDMGMEPEDNTEEISAEKLSQVDPEFSVASSQWAPYDKATRMKVDTVDDFDHVRLINTTASDSSMGRSKRSILKHKTHQLPHADDNVSDLVLSPVIPTPHNNTSARQGQ